MLGQSYYDMRLYVDIMEKGARFKIHERGVVLKDVYVKDETMIEYLVINEILGEYVTLQNITDSLQNSLTKKYGMIGEPYLAFSYEVTK